MDIGGWKTRSVFDRYNVVSERDLPEAAASLNRHVAEVESAYDNAKARKSTHLLKTTTLSC
jgi:hypothetical protein